MGFRILGLVEGLGLRIRVEGFGVGCMCVCVCHVTPLTHHNTLLPPLQHIHTGGRAFFRCGPNCRGVDATPTHAADGSALFARCRTVSPFARSLSIIAIHNWSLSISAIHNCCLSRFLVPLPLSAPASASIRLPLSSAAPAPAPLCVCACVCVCAAASCRLRGGCVLPRWSGRAADTSGAGAVTRQGEIS